MHSSHITALKEKHTKLEREIDREMSRAGRDNALIGSIKKEKLRLKEEIERLQSSLYN